MFPQTFKNFHIIFNPLNERNSVSGGDLLTGHFSFDLGKVAKITSITITLTGRANVHWSTGGGGGRRRRRTRRHHSAKIEFFNFKSVIVQENGGMRSARWIRHVNARHSWLLATGGAATLQPGTHMYPFTCQLPQGDFPSAFHGVHGQITYTLTVAIHRPWHLSKDFVTELNFVNHFNTDRPELWAPLLGSNSMTLCCLWCASGPVTMTARLQKKAFIPGEKIKITCDFSNASSRKATPKARLQQKQHFYTHNKVSRVMVAKNLVSLAGPTVDAHVYDMHSEMELTIPVSAPLTISNCAILQVEYMIELSLSVRGSYDLTVLFPIILYNTHGQTQPPPYL